MTVKDLSPEQFAELKESYYYQLLDTDDEVLIDGEKPKEYIFPSDIPDEVIHEHYKDISFVSDDFFCTAVKPRRRKTWRN